MKRILSIALALMLLAAGACSQAAQSTKPLSKQAFMLNTSVTVTLYESQDQSILDGVLALCQEYEQLLSRTIEGSDVYRINHASGAPVMVSDVTAELLAIALRYAELSGGAFDPTVEPLTALWNIMGDDPKVPDDGDIQTALTKVDRTRIQLDGNTVTMDAGMSIDLGAIAKGYIGDRMRDYLSERGITSAMINLGGNVLTLGSKPGDKPFLIGVRKPFGAQSDLLGAYSISGMSVVTSGVYERYFEQDGTLYHHILDTATGYPVDNGLHSVTILSPDSTDGDALSTICFALGPEDGIALIESLDGIEAVFCKADGTLVFSSGASAGWRYPDEL